ncbi:3477_t:CDS:2, partial [Paraglomus occultum]
FTEKMSSLTKRDCINVFHSGSNCCASNCYAPPTGNYGPDCDSTGGGVTGADSNAQITYSLTVSAATGILVCCEGRGFGGWYNLGCNVNGDSFATTVPWGQIIATPSIHCRTSDPNFLDFVTVSYLC